MKISVVVPVLNEQVNLMSAIQSVRDAVPAPEIIVADGGSVDGSLEGLLAQPDVRVVHAKRGKGVQQNAGGFLATGDAILFLHADCRLPVDAGQQLESTLADPRIAGGCFFARWSRDTRALRLVAFGMNLRTVLRRTSYGDQALFIRRSVFHQVGGFPDWPLFEDTELVRRMKTAGRFAVIRSPVTISPRRFEKNGIFYGVFLVYFLQIGFLLGISPVRLKKWFVDVRPHLELQGKKEPKSEPSE